MNEENDKRQPGAGLIDNNGPILPNFGLAIACERPAMQLCKPKLLQLKTYSYIKMQIQAKNRLDQPTRS